MTATRLSPLVRVVLAPNPSPYTLEGTNTYLVGERRPLVIDPGPAHDGHLDAVLDAAGEPAAVLLTHRHPDHAEGAERFAAMARAPLAAFPMTHASVCAEAGSIEDGQTVSTDGATLRAMFTPGHAPDHLCFLLAEEGSMFSGDHVLGRGTSVVAHPDGDMAAYLASLRAVIDAAPVRLYPGHGPVVDAPDEVLSYYLQHRLDREREVLGAIDAGLRSIPDMVEKIYAAYDRALWGAAGLSVAAHLAKLRDDGVVTEGADGWVRA